MIDGGWERFAGRRVLLLQGPVGPFFRRLAAVLHAVGAEYVHKVNFNGGDWLFSPAGATCYRGPMDAWPKSLARLVEEHAIDTIFLFGDCREIHVPVRGIAKAASAEVWVFEEGYVRPDYITLERSGVNNHSDLPRDPAFYRGLPDMEQAEERPVGNVFWHAAAWAFLYYLAAIVMARGFPFYRHHRLLSAREVLPWLRSPWRKLVYKVRERKYRGFLCGEASKRFFLVPLQVNTDAQVRVHSPFGSVAEFIEHVVKSFSEHAARDHILVIKHHPMDRGYHCYAALIRALAVRFRLVGRLIYLHDQHLPTLLDHALGVVLINSTVGLSAMNHGLPMVVLGDAVYAMPQMTFQEGLDAFWQAAGEFKLDCELYQRFRNYLIHHTQLNGSFFRHGVFVWRNVLARKRLSTPREAMCARTEKAVEDLDVMRTFHSSTYPDR
ncbi:capsule biosynthesis protein [Ralstonia sp. 25C]|uniref:capsule biosynthesis protein n=1 Tax=Ralstonia sp. 25C TaxID=3447363 RepID=UPI003F754708